MREPYQNPEALARTVPTEVQSTEMSGRRRGKPWCKLWVEAITTPKVANLSNDQFRWWVTLLAIATKFDGEGQGRLPDLENVAAIIGRGKTEADVQAAVDGLGGGA